ncbi:MAG: hypothetical protein AAGF11_08990 [Myxococcota bacterium]
MSRMTRRRWGAAMRIVARTVASAVVGAVIGLVAPGGLVRAHHVPGHSGSEGVRNFNSLGGGTGQALNRVAILSEISSNSTSQTPGTVYNTSLLGEYSPHPWVSFGAQLPLLVIDPSPTTEDGQISEDPPPAVGYGDTRAFVRLTPHADKLVHRVLTTAVSASFPTRSVDYPFSDPGPVWTVSPTLIYSRTYAKAYWQVLGVGTVEHRRAGTAVDTSFGGQVGYRFFGNRLAAGVGTLGDLRVATFCSRIGRSGQDWCPTAARLQDNPKLRTEGRFTENDRPIGALRMAALLSVSYSFSSWGLLAANVQAPLFTRRDFDVAGSLTLQAMF